jgi:hypothetical protein
MKWLGLHFELKERYLEEVVVEESLEHQELPSLPNGNQVFAELLKKPPMHALFVNQLLCCGQAEVELVVETVLEKPPDGSVCSPHEPTTARRAAEASEVEVPTVLLVVTQLACWMLLDELS